MSENKRFIIPNYPSDIEDTLTGKKYAMSSYYTHIEIICDLLNELNDKNELFRQNMEEYRKLSLHFERRNNELISDKAFLEKENEELKSFIKGTCIFCGANLRQQYIEKYRDIE